jgi:hypothetical protein
VKPLGPAQLVMCLTMEGMSIMFRGAAALHEASNDLKQTAHDDPVKMTRYLREHMPSPEDIESAAKYLRRMYEVAETGAK